MDLPQQLIESLNGVKGFDREAFNAIHQSGEQVVSIRLNPAKPAVAFPDAEQIPWCANGRYLPERPSFTLDPIFHAGGYYVQEASSMFLEFLLKQILDGEDSLNALDLCGAPGGKTTLLASLPFFKMVVANEIIKTRVGILHENLSKWGLPHCFVTNNDPRDFQRLPAFFDVMVIDAPCSGSGLFRKDHEAIKEWSARNVQLCCERQQRILADALPTLKEGGYLIYSTCSFSEAEDEDILDWLGNQFNLDSIQIQVPPEWGIVETQSREKEFFGYRFYPNRLKGEGFFIACMRRNDGESDRHRINKKEQTIPKAEKEGLNLWLKQSSNWQFLKLKDDYFALPAEISQDYNKLEDQLSVRKRGVRLGSVIRGELIPDHELALSTIIAGHVPFTEVNRELALKYLRKQELQLGNDLKGWNLIKFEGLNLGWIKALKGRINNYYPSAWRIVKL